jgi:alkylation response protein AidB-like acyl-CoA dehydrogenase
MDSKQHTSILAGAIALAKVQITLTAEFCTREAVQIFGGLGYTRAGVAGIVERAYREVRPIAVGGGSEEVMLDLGVRNASKLMPKL